MNPLYFGTAFVAGIVSFLAPCVLPIIPGFLAYPWWGDERGVDDEEKGYICKQHLFCPGILDNFCTSRDIASDRTSKCRI